MQYFRESFNKPRLGRRMAALIVGVVLMGAGIAVFDQLGFGTDPSFVFNYAVSRLLGWKTGTWLVMMNVVLLAILFFCKELRRIGIGSILNILLVGYSADFVGWLFDKFWPLAAEPMVVKLIVFVPTMAIFLFAVALYMVVDMGVAPYDAMPMMIADRMKWKFSVVRLVWDLVILGIGWALGGVVGLVTVVTGFCLGPVLAAIFKRIRPFFEE